MFTTKVEELCLRGEGKVLCHGTEVLDMFGLTYFEVDRHRLDPEARDLLQGLLGTSSVRGLKITQNFGSKPNFKVRVCFDRVPIDHLVFAFNEIAQMIQRHMPELAGAPGSA